MNVSIGQYFLYDNAIFVTQQYDLEKEGYYGICIASRNCDKYYIGEEIHLDKRIEVEIVSTTRLEEFISKD